MSARLALVIANTEYNDPGLAQLTAPGKDAEDFARVLKDPGICAFDEVNILLNEAEHVVRAKVDEFFDQKKPDDLLLLYFSGHGVRDELGALYLAVKNTNRLRLRSTALKSDFIREAMDQSRSKRQLLILDCCNSGAFGQGMKAATGVSIGTSSAFEAGAGRIILTASDSTQFAWEGDSVIGETDNSLFTHFLVKGLEGDADLDGDGNITVDELYDYAYENVRSATPKQTPSKFSSKQQGEIVLRQITRIEDIKPVSLPTELIEAAEDSRTFVREGAVQQLAKILTGKNLGLARSAREVLERLEKEDDSRRVSQVATQALEAIRTTEQKAEAEQRAKTESPAKIEIKEDRLVPEELVAAAKIERGQKPRGIVSEVNNSDRPIGWQFRLPSLQSIFAINIKQSRRKVMIAVIGLLVILLAVWVFLPEFVLLSSTSASPFSNSSSIASVKITNVDYGAHQLLLNGIRIVLDVQTTDLYKDQPCQVIVYFKFPTGDDLEASRSLATIISPYISSDRRVSVYANLKPSHESSIWKVKLFMPYSAIGEGNLLAGTSRLEFYAVFYDKDFNPIARSLSIPFSYTR